MRDVGIRSFAMPQEYGATRSEDARRVAARHGHHQRPEATQHRQGGPARAARAGVALGGFVEGAADQRLDTLRVVAG
jgi:hypothetical protein